MPRDFPRSRRVEEQIQRLLSESLQGARDPRLRLAIVTSVRLSRDLGVARVYATSLDPDHDPEEVCNALKHAAGFLRSTLANGLTVRQVPELRFQYDDTSARANSMDALIKASRARDQDDGDDAS